MAAKTLMQCPVQKAFVVLEKCLTCRFHAMGVDCPHHKRVMPQVYCEMCLKANGGTMPCPYSIVVAGRIKMDKPVLIAGLCSFPRIIQRAAYEDVPTDVLTAALKE